MKLMKAAVTVDRAQAGAEERRKGSGLERLTATVVAGLWLKRKDAFDDHDSGANTIRGVFRLLFRLQCLLRLRIQLRAKPVFVAQKLARDASSCD